MGFALPIGSTKVTSFFSAWGRETLDVLRGYIAPGLISFGIPFLLVMQAHLEYS